MVIRKLLLDIQLPTIIQINFKLSEECNSIFEAVVFVAPM